MRVKRPCYVFLDKKNIKQKKIIVGCFSIFARVIIKVENEIIGRETNYSQCIFPVVNESENTVLVT